MNINEFKEAQLRVNVTINCVVKSISEADTTGKSYNQCYVTIEDLTGTTTFVMWKTLEDVSKTLQTGGLYEVAGVVGEYKGNNQLTFNSARALEDNDVNRKRYDPSSLKTLSTENEQVFMVGITKMFSDVRYKRYAEIAFGLGELPKGLRVSEEEYRARFTNFKKAWASTKFHDSYKGGLAMHYGGMIRLFNSIKAIYGGPDGPKGRFEHKSNVNWDKILLCIYFHDIEKQTEYILSEDGKECVYNPDIKINHIIRGLSRLDLVDREVEEDLRLELGELESIKQSLLCHHGQWGAFEVKTSEDKILHCIDVLDASNVDELVFVVEE